MRPFGFENADHTIDIVLQRDLSPSYHSPNSSVYSTFHPIIIYSICGILSTARIQRAIATTAKWSDYVRRPLDFVAPALRTLPQPPKVG